MRTVGRKVEGLGACLRTWLGVVWRWSVILTYFLGLDFFLSARAVLAQTIVPDGRTQTSVSTQGVVSDVRTSTVSGSNAFNSFQRFGVQAGTTANLHLPAGTANLVNIVRDQRTDVHGILNAIKEGRIGGNIYFANPYGFLVGGSGVVNVGSLTLSTPTLQFVDRFFVAPGSPDSAALAQLLAGTAPRSGAGVITIDGKVNAADGVTLDAGTISVGGTLFSGARFLGTAPDFSDVVNANGLNQATNVVLNEGRVHIVADGDVTVTGTIAAPGGSGVRGGEIAVLAGGNVDLRPGAIISARGNGESSPGGWIHLWADRDAAFRAGATVDARGGASGDGGIIELSAKGKVTLDGGEFLAKANRGRHGSVLIDPAVIEATTSGRIIDGGPITFSADDSITVLEGVVLSSRDVPDGTTDHDAASSEGDSGSITLSAPSIVLKPGAKLFAHADGSFVGGDVTLTATKTDHMSGLRAVDATTKVEVDGATIRGRNITLEAKSDAAYEWGGDPATVALRTITETGLFMLSGVNAGVAISDAKAEVLVKSGAVLDAQGSGGSRGSVVLNADSKSKAEHLKLGLGAFTTNDLFNVGFVWGEANATATVDVASGATIKAGELSATAKNTADTSLTVLGFSNQTSLNAAAVVNLAQVHSSATLASGANIDVNRSVLVRAHNQNEFTSNAVSMAMNTGQVGIGFNYTGLSTSATAASNANLQSAGLEKVTVEALNDTVKNKSSASTAAGTGLVGKAVSTIVGLTDTAVDKLIEKVGGGPQSLDSTTGATEKPKLGAAVTYADNVHNATASIGSGALVTAAKDVVVAAKVNDQRIRTHATSSVDGKKNDPNNPGTSLGLSAAVSVGLFQHNAKAYIGDNASVTAQNIGVRSELTMPYEITWAKWEGFSTIFSKLNSNLGIADGLVSGWSNASSGGCVGFCLSGAVTYMDVVNSSDAYVGRGAQLHVAPGGPESWSTTLTGDSTAFVGTNNTTIPETRTLSWDTPVHLRATSDVQGVYVAGNMSLMLAGAGGEPGATAAGGVYNQVNFANTTRAWVAEGSEIEQTSGAPVNVTVSAEARSQITAVAPSSGRGGSYGANLIYSRAKIDDKTEASVDDEAQVSAAALDVSAEQDVVSWSLAGALNSSAAAGVGAGVAVNDTTTDTRAKIADNDINNVGGSALSLTDGKTTAADVSLLARTDGRIEAIGVAGAAASSSDPNEQPGLFSKAKTGFTSMLAKIPGLGKLVGGDSSGGSAAQQQPQFGLAIAGSAAVNLVTLGTRAYLDGAELEQPASGATSLSIAAVNDTDVTAATGSGALARANNPSSGWSAGVAGSVSVNQITNTTEAYVKGSTVTNAQDASVLAAAGGEQLAVAIGLAVNLSTANPDRAGSGAGSVSVNLATNTVSARVENATLDGQDSGAERAADIVAYDRLKVGTGGGSLIAGGKGGVGAAVSYSEVSNTTEAVASGATVTDYDTLDVHALTGTKIGAGGGMVAFPTSTPDGGGTFGGAFVISDIGNIVKGEIKSGSDITVGSAVQVRAADTTGVAALDGVIDAQDGGQPNAASLDYDGTGIGQSAGAGSSIVSVAGVAQVGASNVGLSFNYNKLHNSFTASINESAVSAGAAGSVEVLAESNASMLGLALGVGIATDKFAGAGSLGLNEVENGVTAEVVSTTGKKVTAGALTVKAEDKSRTDAVAGNVSASLGNGSFGAAVSVNDTTNTVRADIAGAEIDAQISTEVSGKNDSQIRTLALSAGGSASLAFNGSAAASEISNTTEAFVRNAKSDDGGNAVSVTAADTSRIDALAGAAAFSGKAAAGIAVSANRITNFTHAYVDGVAAGSRYGLQDLQVRADSNNRIRTLAVGAGASGSFGLGGSVAVNLVENTTDAYITGGAKVDAENNVGVIAEADDKVQLAAGAAGVGVSGAGVGVAVTVNKIGGTTQAYVSGAQTEVNARARDAGSTMTVNAGDLAGAGVDLGSGLSIAEYNNAAYTLADLRATESTSGLAVNASATHQLETIVANIGGGLYAGIAATTNVNLVGGETKAYIDAATVNGGVNTGAGAQNVSVKAADHAYANGFVGTVAAGGAGVGLGADANAFQRATRAYVSNGAQVNARDAFTAAATSTQGSSSLAAGGAGGGVGVAGTVSVSKFTSTTEAYVSGSSIDAGSVTVEAEHDSRMFVAAGAVALGGLAGSGAFAVGVDSSTTKAYLDDAQVDTAGAVNVGADNNVEIRNFAVSGAGSAAGSIAGMAVVATTNSTTQAYATGSRIGTADEKVAGLSITAKDRVVVDNKAGAGSVGFVGAGIGAGVAVVKVDNTTSSFVDAASTVHASGDVAVRAEAERAASQSAFTLGMGLQAGISGTVAVTLIGRELAGDAASELDGDGSGTVTAIDSYTDAPALTSGGNIVANPLSAEETQSINASAAIGVKSNLNSAALAARTSALVNDSQITAGGNVTIVATEKDQSEMLVGAVAAGGLGVGGAVGITNIAHNVDAGLLGGAAVTSTGGSVEISAETGRLDPAARVAKVRSFQGSGGAVSLGAAVAIGELANNVSAYADDGTTASVTGGSGGIRVRAADAADVETEAIGATVGAVAAGAVIARSDKRGSAQARVGDAGAAQPTTASLASGTLSIEAVRSGETKAKTIAGSGGVLAGAGSDARASDVGGAKAFVGDAVTFTGAAGALSVSSLAQPQTHARAEGYGGAIAAFVGVSIAKAHAEPTVEASIGESTITARDVAVNAAVTQPATWTARTEATAAGGGLLLGLTSTESAASSVSKANAQIRDGAELHVSGSTTVTAGNSTDQSAWVSGVSVGGLAAGGEANGLATSDSTTVARLDKGVGGEAGALAVRATGDDENYSEAKSGGGAIVAGAAAKARTQGDSNTRAELGGGSGSDDAGALQAKAVTLAAQHTARFNSKVDTLVAAVVGGSGGSAYNGVSSRVESTILEDANLRASSLDAAARNIGVKPLLSGYNAEAASGGLFSGAAAGSRSDIGLVTLATVGGDATVRLTGDPDLNPGSIVITASNDLFARDRTKLDTGGAIAVARAQSQIYLNQADANTTVASGADLYSVGDINLSSLTKADIEASANAKTYGLAGAAEGLSEAIANSNNLTRVEAGAALRAEGHIRLNAGRDENGQANVHRAKARTDLYNKTALPISTDPDANAIISTANRIEVAGGARVEAVKDIFLFANKGQMSADGRGVGKDLYREILAAIGSFFSNLFGGGDVSLDIHGGFSSAGGTATVTVDGLVAAGVQHRQRLVIDVHGTITEQTDGVRIRFRGSENLRSNIGARIVELQEILAQWSGEPDMKDALEAEVARLQAELDRLAPQPFTDAELDQLVLNETLTREQADAIKANQRPGGSLEGATLITVTEVENVRARGGDIFVEGDSLGGSGTLKAPGDAEISLINESPQYLRTNKLTIVDDVGGRVRLNGRAISAMGGLTIESSGPASAKPKIHVENSYNPALAGNPGAPTPDIEVRGDVINRFGEAIIKNVKGSIRVEAPPGTTSAPNIIAETIRIEAGRDFVQAYVDGAVSVGGSPEALWNAEATAAQAGTVTVTRNASAVCGSAACKDGKGSVIAGNNVFISARYLNINGTVQSGLPDWQLTIPAVPGIVVNAGFSTPLSQQLSSTGYAGPALTQVDGKTFVPLQALVHARTHGIEVPYEFQQGPRYQLSGFATDPQGTVASFYNADTNRIELDSVRVEGGYMELFGEILNTGGGRIRVMDGFGRINIANHSGFDLQMNGLDAGNVEGKLRITDTARRYLQSTGEILTNPSDPHYLNARPVTTTYTRVGDDVSVAFSSKRTITTNGVAQDEVVDLGSGLFAGQIGADGSRSGFYDPVAGRKYVWGLGKDFTQAYSYSRQFTTFLSWPVASAAFGEAHEVPGSGVERDLTQTRLAWAGAGQTSDYQFTYSNFATSSPTLQWARNTNWCSFWLFGCIVRTYKQEYHWTQGRTEYKVHSVTADKRIPIEFVGYDTGSVSLASAGNVILKSGIRSGNGLASVTSTGGAILSETGQPIIGNGISLEASTGIGSSVAPIEVQLAGGNLRAVTATGNIGLRASGNARIELVSSGTGDIWMSGNRSLLGAGSGTHHVNGRMVELHAAESIGSAGAALKVQTGGDSLQAGLIARAPDGINIDQPSGDLRLVSVESSGDVRLATQGDFVDGNLNDQKDTRAIEELQAQWADMRLLGTAAQQAADETVAAYRAERRRQYETYWSYRKTPSYDAQGHLTGATIQAHDPNFTYVVSASEQAQLIAGGVTDIAGYAAKRTAEYHGLHAELAKTDDVASYDPNWQPALSASKVAELRDGAVWTENQLKYSVARGIVSKNVTDTELRIEEANVKGDSVTLVSRAGGVGRNLGEQTFTTAQLAAKGLDPDQRADLAAAELDDIAMVDADTLRLTQRDDVDVVANRISIDAKGRVYLGSELNLNIDALKTDDSIRIKGAQSIFRVGTPNDPAAASIRGGSLILEAAQGAIGTAGNPLTTALMPGATLTARAAHDIHVREIEGAISALDVFSRLGSVSLQAVGDLRAARITLPGSLLLAGEDIDALIAYLGSDTLSASVFGGRTTAAGRVALVFDTPTAVVFERLWAREASLPLLGDPLQINDGFIGERMLASTPGTRLLMDNTSLTPQPGYDVQLFAPDKTFWLYMGGKFVRTRLAHVIYRDESGHPDLSERLEGADSSVRELAREELARFSRLIVLPFPGSLLIPSPPLVEVGAAPVNLEE